MTKGGIFGCRPFFLYRCAAASRAGPRPRGKALKCPSARLGDWSSRRCGRRPQRRWRQSALLGSGGSSCHGARLPVRSCCPETCRNSSRAAIDLRHLEPNPAESAVRQRRSDRADRARGGVSARSGVSKSSAQAALCGRPVASTVKQVPEPALPPGHRCVSRPSVPVPGTGI